MVMAKQEATTPQRILVNQVRGGEKNIIHKTATAFMGGDFLLVNYLFSNTIFSRYFLLLTNCRSLRIPGHLVKCFESSSSSSGSADSVTVCVSTLNEYFGFVFSIRVVYFLPSGRLLMEVVVSVEPGDIGRLDLAIM